MNEEELELQDNSMVTFGSVIAISDFNDQNAYIFSDGFLQNSVYLRNFVHKEIKKKMYEGLENDSFFKCLFQVVPRVSDTAKVLAIRKVADMATKHTHKLDETEPYDYKNRYKIKNINEYLSALMNEYKQNIDTIEKSRMGKLMYHQPFQLLHVASGKFLACLEMEATYENQNYRMVLQDFTNELTVFSIVPAYKYQSFGEQDVNAGEMCAIARVQLISNRQAYVHCSNLEMADLKHNAGITHKMEHIGKREINASVEESHSWKIVLFQPYIPDNSRNIRVGDCIWLYHSEAEATLSVLKKKAAVDKQNFTFYNLSEWLALQNLFVSVSTSDKDSTQGYQGGTNGLWQIEGSDLTTGGFVQFEQAYRIRNVSSGYYLCVVALESKKKSTEYQFALTHKPDKSSEFVFVDLKTQAHQKYVMGGSYTYLRSQLYKNWVDFQKNSEHLYQPILKPPNEKTEHAVFKVHMATRNEMWEINFLMSCFRMLAKFLILVQNPDFPGVDDFQSKKKMFMKFDLVRKCIQDLEDFVNNKIYTTSPDQIYGEINQSRQQLLKDQFYIDILVKVLDRIITKGELEFYQKDLEHERLSKQHTIFQQTSKFQLDDEEIDDEQTQLQKMQVLDYIKGKVRLLDQIYQFLGSVCKFNTDNQLYTFDLIPYFQLQTKYLPNAIDTIIDIVAGNKPLLFKLSEGLQIDYNQEEEGQIKVLINLYDGFDGEQGEEEVIPFKAHEKITSKPVNLIQYFVNLIWDEEAINNSYYLKFLRKVCNYQQEPIQINQENIYKLYKIYNDKNPRLGVETKAEESKFNDGTVRLMSRAGQLIIPKDCNMHDSSRSKFMYIIEQLMFFSEVALGRNFFWKKELGSQFEKSFLFRNIWNDRPMDERYEDLKPCFAKLALCLYVDQEPLKLKGVPGMCRLFSEINKPLDYKVFKSSVDGTSNVQELNTYNDLVFNLKGYYQKLRSIISMIVEPPKQEGGYQEVEDIGQDLLSDELILNSTHIFERILKLELLWVLDYSLEGGARVEKPAPFISELVEILLYIFQYDKFELNFVKAHVQTLNGRIKTALEKKTQPIALQAGGFGMFTGGKSAKKVDDDGEDAKGEQGLSKEQHLYLNPVMRGYLKLQAQLQIFNYMDPIYVYNEVQLKIKICDVFEYLLDLRQDFMMHNALIFFKAYILEGEHIENDEVAFREKLRIENKKKKSNRVHYSLLSRTDLNRMIIQRLLKTHHLGLLPNLANTGIKDIDQPQSEGGNLTGMFSAFGKMKDQKPKECFYNYLAEQQVEVPEIMDLDQYLSAQLGDPRPMDKCVGSLLPTLLNTFTNIVDKQLEKRCLRLILRMFTQKQEFKQNMETIQVIFDSEKTVLYRFLVRNLDFFQKLIDRLDNWLQLYVSTELGSSYELDICASILRSMNMGLLTDIQEQDGELVANSNIIDPQKQQLYANLKCHDIVCSFITEGIGYFHDYILEGEMHELKRIKLIEVFTLAYEFLRKLCYNHFDNQLLVFEMMPKVIVHLQYDIGQIALLAEMFRDNKFLLIQRVDYKLVQTFITLVQREGRQVHFLAVLEVLIKYRGKYIFDNQLIVLNCLLPAEMGDKQIKTLYSDGSKPEDLRFYLEDPLHHSGLSFVQRLQEIQFRDTFRDEPFHFHRQLLDILLQSTLVSVDQRDFLADRAEEQVKENFNISVSRLKSLYSAEYLLELLRVKDSFGEHQQLGINIIKLQVVEFLRLVHISSERGQLPSSQLYYCQDQVVDLFEIELKRVERFQNLQINMPQDLQDYYMKGLLPFALAYYDRFLKRLMEQQSNKQDMRKDMHSLERFVRILYFKLVLLSTEEPLYPLIQTTNQAKLMARALRTLCEANYEKLSKQLAEGTPEDDTLAAMQKLEGLLQDVPNMPARSIPDQQQEQVEQPKKKKKKQQKSKVVPTIFDKSQAPEEEKLIDGYASQQSDEVGQFWGLFVKELVGNETFEKEDELERERIANAFISIQDLLDSKFTKQVPVRPDVKSISKKLIFYLQSAFNDPSCKDSIMILLRVLQKIIGKEEDSQKKIEMQNLFDRLGATQMVLLVLSENNRMLDKKLLMSFISFMNTMLEGGNIQVQNTIFQFMLDFPQSENIFQKVYLIIRKQIENIEVISKSKKAKGQANSNDAAMGMLQIDEKEFAEDLKLVKSVLNFIQGSVEGHYLSMQNYFRIQKNSRNNYDLTNTITDLFKTYYYEDCSQQNYDNMIQCLDTLNELVQGPCPENQISVSESKFLDIAANLFGQEEEQEIIEVEIGKTVEVDKEKLAEWMVARLKNKVLNLLLSLLEARDINENNQVLKRIMRNLNLQLLERHSVLEYNRYVLIYGDKYQIEALQHMVEDPRKLRKRARERILKETPTYFETVLQNGFLLFFLMSYYMECDPHLLSPIVLMHKKHKKKVLQLETGNFLLQFLKTSIIWLLYGFLQELISGLFGTLNQFKNMAANQIITDKAVIPSSPEEVLKLKESKYREDLELAVTFYMLNSAHIDIMHDGNLEIVYFIKLPMTKYMPKEQKILFHDEVDRSTTQSKVQGLINQSLTIIEVCKHEEYLKKWFEKQKIIAAFTNYVQLWKELAFLLTLFLNIFILFSFDGTWGDRVQDYVFFNNQDFTPAQTKTLIYIIGLVMTCLSMFVVGYFLLKNAPLILKRAWLQKGLFDDMEPNPIFALADLGYKLVLIILSFLQEIEVMYYIAYGVFAILGTFIHPFFFIFHLSEILFRYPTLKNIILSVYQPRNQLVLTFFLLILLVYMFTLIAYVFISSENYGGYCDTLLYCFLLNIEWTFRGAIGGYVQEIVDQGNVALGIGVGRFFFDELSNIILGVIMLNIVAGIIIDTFGSLREVEMSKLEDIADKCFICGNLKADFDRLQSKTSGGFREHIKINHYMWNYLYFIAYIHWKDPIDYSGIESYVAQMLKDEDLGWVPIGKARELKDLEGDDSQREKELIQKIDDKMSYVADLVKEMSKEFKVEQKSK